MLTALALGLLVTGAVLALVLPGGSRRTAAPPAGGTPSAPPSRTGPAATVARGTTDLGTALVRWAATELPAGSRLVAAPGVADALRRAGVPAGVVAPDGAAPPGMLEVTDGATPAGSRLVATFGSPPALAVVDPVPRQPTPQELRRRTDLAAALLANPTVRIAGTAAPELRAAAVDPRLLSVLAALASRSQLEVAALPAADGEPADVPLARSALVTQVGGSPAVPGSPGVQALVAFLQAQLPPYAPDEVTVTDRGVLVDFHYLSGPDATVTSASY